MSTLENHSLYDRFHFRSSSHCVSVVPFPSPLCHPSWGPRTKRGMCRRGLHRRRSESSRAEVLRCAHPSPEGSACAALDCCRQALAPGAWMEVEASGSSLMGRPPQRSNNDSCTKGRMAATALLARSFHWSRVDSRRDTLESPHQCSVDSTDERSPPTADNCLGLAPCDSRPTDESPAGFQCKTNTLGVARAS